MDPEEDFALGLQELVARNPDLAKAFAKAKEAVGSPRDGESATTYGQRLWRKTVKLYSKRKRGGAS